MKTQAEDWGLSLPENRGPLPIPMHLQDGLTPCVCPVRCAQNCVDIGLRAPGCGISPVKLEVVSELAPCEKRDRGLMSSMPWFPK